MTTVRCEQDDTWRVPFFWLGLISWLGAWTIALGHIRPA
jgi:hypothetical protein